MSSIFDRVCNGYNLYMDLVTEKFRDSSNYIVLINSEDDEINDYTIDILPAFRELKKISHYIIISPIDGMEDVLKYKCKVPYTFLQYSVEDVKALCKYLSIIRKNDYEMREIPVIVNGGYEYSDVKLQHVIGYNGITKRDYVAMVVFQLSFIPEDMPQNDLIKEYSYKKINWNNYNLYDYDNADDCLNRIIETKKISKNDSIVIFSVTKSAFAVFEKLNDYNVVAFIDNNKSISGSVVKGIPVTTPDELLKNSRKKYRIIVPIRSYKLICEQLYYWGYELGKNVFVTYPARKRTFGDIDQIKQKALLGEKIYKEIRKQYTNQRLYINPYPGTGDMYMTGIYIKDRMQYDKITECVLLVVNNTCKKVFELVKHNVNILEVKALNGTENVQAFLYYVKTIGYDKTNVCLLNDTFDLMDLGYMRNFKKLDFNTVSQRTVFMANEKKFGIDVATRNSSDFFEINNLQQKKTVLLSPYAHSVREIDDRYWIMIADELLKMNYNVVTNVAGDEKPIPGTVGLYVPFDQVIDFVDRAGVFIALRSGLCDIVSGSSAKKIILYFSENGEETYEYNFFGLGENAMGFCSENIWEYVVYKNNISEVIDNIKCILS